MVGIVAVLVLVTVSVVVTRIGAAALEVTGVSRDLAHFQARSAFTGVGYTTSEAEDIANHPGRRRIVQTLMLFGNAGIVSVIATLVIGLRDSAGGELAMRLGVLVAGLAVLWVATSRPAFNRWVKRAIDAGLRRWTDLEVQDYIRLLDVEGEHAVHDVHVREGGWLAGSTLQDLNLSAEGVLVLGLRRSGGEFLGAPQADTEIRPGDTVLLYGRRSSLEELGYRPSGPQGDAEHARGVTRHGHAQAAEQARDQQHQP